MNIIAGVVFLILTIGIFVFVAAFALAFSMRKRRFKVGLKILALLLGIATVLLGLGYIDATGWEELDYIFGFLFIDLPAGLGALIGGVAGWSKSADQVDAP